MQENNLIVYSEMNIVGSSLHTIPLIVNPIEWSRGCSVVTSTAIQTSVDVDTVPENASSIGHIDYHKNIISIRGFYFTILCFANWNKRNKKWERKAQRNVNLLRQRGHSFRRFSILNIVFFPSRILCPPPMFTLCVMINQTAWPYTHTRIL